MTTLNGAVAALKRKMMYVLFCFALIVTAIVFGDCVYVIARGSADDKKWAAGIVSAIASGLVGFLVGQGKRKLPVQQRKAARRRDAQRRGELCNQAANATLLSRH